MRKISLFLFLIFFSGFAAAADVSFSWDPSPSPNIVGYKFYYGTASRTYGSPILLGNQTTTTVYGLTEKAMYYFAVTAIDSSGNESEFGNEVQTYCNEVAPLPVAAPTIQGVITP